MIELRLLRYFVAVAEAEHVGRAAAVLHVSQSPLSRQIRQLEEATSLTLFAREKQRLRITREGTWLLGRTRPILEQVQALERDAARLAKGQAGALRIGFVKTAMWSDVLPSALRAFRADYPEVGVELTNRRPAVQLKAVMRGELDVAFVHDPPEDAAFTCRKLREEPLCLALGRDHPLVGKKPLTPADLDGTDWIALRARRSGQRPHEALLAACARRGFVPNIRFSATDQDTMVGLVAAGMGVALLPESAGRTLHSALVLRRVPWLAMRRHLHAVAHAPHMSPTAAAFFACLALRRRKPT
jgi:DNA-binding transcriptional LysR family regulator